jgi:hypothetical protein
MKALINMIAAVLHKIRIKLHPCRLPGKEGLFIARIDNETVLSVEEVCAALVARGSFTGDYGTLVMYVKCFFDEVVYQLCDGFGVKNRYFSMHPIVGGYFRGPEEANDRKAHPVGFGFQVLPPLQDLTDLITIEASYAKPGGYIDMVTDFESQTVNRTLTPGGLFMAYGAKIRITGNRPENGVWFIPVADPTRRIKAEGGFAENKQNKVIGKVPDLAPGAYTLEIVTQFSGGSKPLKEPRTIAFPEELTVPDKERLAVSPKIEHDSGS